MLQDIERVCKTLFKTREWEETLKLMKLIFSIMIPLPSPISNSLVPSYKFWREILARSFVTWWEALLSSNHTCCFRNEFGNISLWFGTKALGEMRLENLWRLQWERIVWRHYTESLSLDHWHFPKEGFKVRGWEVEVHCWTNVEIGPEMQYT